ncbi:MAG TPA: hypothetical protein DER05_05025 [Lutibacter sp.]|nr:hypothetical protein [Lutibacter sp.]
MKRLILISLFVLPFLGIAQDSDTEFLNFKIDTNEELIWQKVYESNMTLEELQQYFTNESFTANIKLIDDKFSGQSNGKKLGASKTSQWKTMGANLFFDAYIIVDFKEGRYRVTLTDMKFSAVQKYNLWMGGTQNLGTTFEDFFVRKGRIWQKKVVENSLTLYDKEFDDVFTLKENIIKEDW